MTIIENSTTKAYLLDVKSSQGTNKPKETSDIFNMAEKENNSKKQKSDSLTCGILGGFLGMILGGGLAINLEVGTWSKAVDKGLISPYVMASSNRVKLVNWERKNFPKMKELLMKGKLAIPIILGTAAIAGITAATVHSLCKK